MNHNQKFEKIKDIIRDQVHYDVASLIEECLSARKKTFANQIVQQCKAEGIEIALPYSSGSLSGSIPYEGVYEEFVEMLVSKVWGRLDMPEYDTIHIPNK